MIDTKESQSNAKLIAVDLSDPASLGSMAYNATLDQKIYTLAHAHDHHANLFDEYIKEKCSEKVKAQIELEKKYLCQNYEPLPVILTKGEGAYVQDIDGHVYLDFLSAYSAVNQGHSNKNIIDSAIAQMNTLSMTSRAFYNNRLGDGARLVCETFGYDKVLFMNSGVEAGESAVKFARRWGYDAKKIADNHAKIVFANGNFWGRTTYACGTSDDFSRYDRFGPFENTGHYMVDYDDIEALKKLLEEDNEICAVFIEPIQGEGGVKIPRKGYLQEVSALCKKHNVLFVCDEIQTGIGRAGYLRYCESEDVKPDMTLLGKSLSGGLYPVSAVLGSNEVMDLIKPGDHGSTFGANPLAVSIAIAALSETLKTNLIMNGNERGMELALTLKEKLGNNPIVKEIRGRGLMFALELWPECGISAYDMSIWLMERGVLCKPTRMNTLRICPPLVITTEQIERAADTMVSILDQAAGFLSFTSNVPASFNFQEYDDCKVQEYLEKKLKK